MSFFEEEKDENAVNGATGDVITEMSRKQMDEKAAEEAEQKMYEAVYHTEKPSGNAKKKAKNGFRAVVATALICSVAGGGIGGYVGANYAAKGFAKQMVAMQTNTQTGATSVQLVAGSDVSPVVAIAKKVMPSIVGVTVYGDYNYWGRRYANIELGSGSGIVFSEDGYIVTNNHVVENATTVKVTLADNREYEAKIVGTDVNSDIAVLKIDAPDLVAAELGDSDELQIGELVVAIGNPLGYSNTVTDGIVSGLNRQLTDYSDMMLIQTNAAINSGNSGGALVNSRGQVVGINSAKLVASNAEGMGFAISINGVKDIIEEITSKGYVSKPYLGVTINNNYQVDQDTAEKFEIPMGIQIVSVVEGGPAQKAGLRDGDIIYKVNDSLISSFDQLSEIIESSKVGDTLHILAYRDGDKIVADAVLEDSGK